MGETDWPVASPKEISPSSPHICESQRLLRIRGRSGRMGKGNLKCGEGEMHSSPSIPFPRRFFMHDQSFFLFATPSGCGDFNARKGKKGRRRLFDSLTSIFMGRKKKETLTFGCGAKKSCQVSLLFFSPLSLTDAGPKKERKKSFFKKSVCTSVEVCTQWNNTRMEGGRGPFRSLRGRERH